ncbi:AraC family transcriptional regulator [Pacificibacter marinus]|uniref:Arabinose operon regulatory protein n=1 Tax=Pacificibacter marinus TaxID=658057 RepID=A0A1Y5SIA8_9RHOB|nr:AraC family transcriptional regulator [Pacificibacter marinus]SEK61757.1 transcriptional regulator, AraC family [Pacificibacter marinus]SLN41471.1 Arabinose operon regulatory protein [Pacificibacter marinus]
MTDPTTTLPLGLDPLSDTLHALRMQGTLYCRAELRAPWGIEIPHLDGLMGFLVVTSGRVWFEVGNTVARWLEPGSLTLIPHGVPHKMRDAPGTKVVPLNSLPVTPITERYEILQHGGTGDQTRATYCVVQFDSQIARQFLTHLPETIFYQGWDQETDGWMESTLRYVTREAANLRPGGETVLTRLADILIIQAIRAWLDSAPEARQGWLAALRDPQIGRALAAIHRNPEMPWSVASIAKEAALSRSVFSARFTKLVGQSAMTYLTNWRMSAATSLLEETDLTVAMIAERVGYSSEPAFGRAFKRVHGIAPGLKRSAMRAR